MELFDYAKLIGAHITFSGSFQPGHEYVNANIKRDFSDCFLDGGGRSPFGRSDVNSTEKPNLEDALKDLCHELNGHEISFVIGGPSKDRLKVPKLTHTPGYRG